MQAQTDGGAHQLVITPVIDDLVDAIAETVVGLQHGRVGFGEITPRLGFGAACEEPDVAQVVEGMVGALAMQGLEVAG